MAGDPVLARRRRKAALVSGYDAAAPSFNHHRALPQAAAEAIRAAVMAAVRDVTRPRLLDIGAGAGRIGRAFVAACDDYIGIDLSFGMLRSFLAHRTCGASSEPAPRLAQADGKILPFGDAGFEAVMMMQVFGGMRDWRQVISEARRVLRPSGAIILGRTLPPSDGLDVQMKQRLASVLSELGLAPGSNFRDEAAQALVSTARSAEIVIAACWRADRTARHFLERRRAAAQFSALPEQVKEDVLRRLAVWAVATFGSLNAVQSEPYAFELQVFKFA